MIRLYRKRFIPNETVYLKDDIILYQSDNLIITSWKTLKPRKDIAYGTSAYFMDQGYKVSKMYDSKDTIVYWYCDIIETEKDLEHDSITFTDLLVDVLVYENGDVKVIDFAELADAFDSKLITGTELSNGLRSLDQLLSAIYENRFYTLQDCINNIEKMGSTK